MVELKEGEYGCYFLNILDAVNLLILWFNPLGFVENYKLSLPINYTTSQICFNFRALMDLSKVISVTFEICLF